MVEFNSVTVASRVSPSPSAVTMPPVAAPGRVRFAKASRTSGERGRGSAFRPRRSPSASSRSSPSAAMAPTRNSAANTGEGASTMVSAATQSAAPPDMAR